MDDRIQTLTLGGEEYVIMPRAEYERLAAHSTDGEIGADAVTFERETVGRSLRLARETAGLTQQELAARLAKSQAMVSGSESGRVKVGAAYVKAVLRACGLPPDWAPPKPRSGKKPARETFPGRAKRKRAP